VSHKEKVSGLTGEYSAGEIKSIVGQCNLFISLGKFHPYVFATSQGVPTILVGQDMKLRAIATLLGQEKWFTEALPGDELIKNAWLHRHQISQELRERQEEIRDRALLNARLVKELARRLSSPQSASGKQKAGAS